MKAYHYGRYVCRIEMGNSAHKLELYTWLHGAPVKLDTHSLVAPLLLALVAFIITIGILLLVKEYYNVRAYKGHNQCAAHHKSVADEELGMRGM